MKRFLIVLLALSLTACSNPKATEDAPPATKEELTQLKLSMNKAFGALEVYAADNSLKYPEKLEDLKPKYLQDIPKDPVSRKAISYKKTEDGFRLGASGDYQALDAEKGFPQMNQDGFFVTKEADFPSDE